MKSVVLQVRAIQDFEELFVNLDVERSVPLVPADEGLRGDLFVHHFLGLLLWLGVLVGGVVLELHVELRRKWVALHVRVWQLLRRRLHDCGGLRQVPLGFDSNQVGISCLNVLLHLRAWVVHMVQLLDDRVAELALWQWSLYHVVLAGLVAILPVDIHVQLAGRRRHLQARSCLLQRRTYH